MTALAADRGRRAHVEFRDEPEFQEKLDWMDRFVREEIEALDVLFADRVTSGR